VPVFAVAAVPNDEPFVLRQVTALLPLVVQSPLSSEDAPVFLAIPVPVKDACLAFNCVWIELVASRYPNVVGVTPSKVLLVRVSVLAKVAAVPLVAGPVSVPAPAVKPDTEVAAIVPDPETARDAPVPTTIAAPLLVPEVSAENAAPAPACISAGKISIA
jgi:hypothetical protein